MYDFRQHSFYSHMDSSLNWDSMYFKEMSFAMNIITEELIAAEFPATLLVDVKSRLPAIMTALQVFGTNA